MLDGLYVPPKPAIIIPAAKKILREEKRILPAGLMLDPLVMFGPPALQGGSWQTISDPTSDGTHTGGYQTYTFRVVVGEAEYSTPSTGTFLRARFKAGSSTWTVGNMYVQHAAAAGDAYDLEASALELLFSSASGFTVTSGNTITSDPLNFSFSASKALVFCWYQASASAAPSTQATKANYKTYTKLANDPTTVDATGYTQNQDGKDCTGIDLIEVFG